jgi:hypothetical protein
MRAVLYVLLSAVFLNLGAVAHGQTVKLSEMKSPYSRKNTFTIFAEYANTSSHILLGESRQRKLADLGGAYSRRIVRWRTSDLNYLAEVRPVLFESDSLTIDHYTETYNQPSGPPITFTGVSSSVDYSACRASSATYTIPPIGTFPGASETDEYTCGRQWTFGQSFAPLGLKYSMRTKRRLQPFVDLTAGYMYTSRPVPMADAEAFNFVFNVGAGMELFNSRERGRSVSAEVRVQHFSNKDTAPANPGTDNVLYGAVLRERAGGSGRADAAGAGLSSGAIRCPTALESEAGLTVLDVSTSANRFVQGSPRLKNVL